MTAQPQMCRLPAFPDHVICAEHDFVYVLDTIIDVMEAKLTIKAGKRCTGVDEKEIMVVVRTIGAQILSIAALIVGHPEAEMFLHPCGTFDIVGQGEDNVIDQLGKGPLAPLAMRIQPVDPTRGVDRIRGIDDWALSIDLQAHGNSEGSDERCAAIVTAAYLDLRFDAADKPSERFCSIDPPNRFAHAIAHHPGG